MQMNITFLGGGNMARSIVGGLINENYPANQITVVDRHAEKLEQLKVEYGINTTQDAASAITSAHLVIFSIKPQGLKDLLATIKDDLLKRNALIVSIMSGIRIETLQDLLPEQAVVRVMPNTPARASAGMSLICGAEDVTEEQLRSVQKVFDAVGKTFITPSERAFEQLTALTGCGPAFVFYLIQQFAKAMEKILPEVDATPLSLETFYGAVTLMQKEGLDPETLIAQVCPKGGMTFEAMKVLRNEDLETLFKDTFQAAIDRGDELAKV